MKALKCIIPIIVGFIAIYKGVFLVKSFSSHLIQSIGAVVNYQYPVIGLLWTYCSFFMGIALIVFGVGVFFRWYWSRIMISVLFIILGSLECSIIVIQTTKSPMLAKDITFESFIILGYFLAAILLSFKFIYSRLFFPSFRE